MAAERKNWFVWVADDAGCAWYRGIVPMLGIQRQGLVDRTRWSMVANGQFLLEQDVLVAQRTANETANPMLWMMEEQGFHYIYDLDDMLWGVEPSNKIAYNFYKQDWVQETIQKTMERAAQITVSTPELAEEVTQRVPGSTVTVIPNTVPDLPGLARDPLEEPVTPDGRKRRPLRVVWAGSRTHDRDLEVIRYGTKKLVERGEIELILMGVEYRDLLPWASGAVPWVPNNEYLSTLARLGADVMLCPVTYSRFNACKSHLKALDAMAAGIIPVASDTVTYNRLITHEKNGFLVSNHEDKWYRQLRQLAALDWNELQSLRRAGLDRASDYLSDKWSQHVADTWGATPLHG